MASINIQIRRASYLRRAGPGRAAGRQEARLEHLVEARWALCGSETGLAVRQFLRSVLVFEKVRIDAPSALIDFNEFIRTGKWKVGVRAEM